MRSPTPAGLASPLRSPQKAPSLISFRPHALHAAAVHSPGRCPATKSPGALAAGLHVPAFASPSSESAARASLTCPAPAASGQSPSSRRRLDFSVCASASTSTPTASGAGPERNVASTLAPPQPGAPPPASVSDAALSAVVASLSSEAVQARSVAVASVAGLFAARLVSASQVSGHATQLFPALVAGATQRGSSAWIRYLAARLLTHVADEMYANLTRAAQRLLSAHLLLLVQSGASQGARDGASSAGLATDSDAASLAAETARLQAAAARFLDAAAQADADGVADSAPPLASSAAAAPAPRAEHLLKSGERASRSWAAVAEAILRRGSSQGMAGLGIVARNADADIVTSDRGCAAGSAAAVAAPRSATADMDTLRTLGLASRRQARSLPRTDLLRTACGVPGVLGAPHEGLSAHLAASQTAHPSVSSAAAARVQPAASLSDALKRLSARDGGRVTKGFPQAATVVSRGRTPDGAITTGVDTWRFVRRRPASQATEQLAQAPPPRPITSPTTSDPVMRQLRRGASEPARLAAGGSSLAERAPGGAGSPPGGAYVRFGSEQGIEERFRGLEALASAPSVLAAEALDRLVERDGQALATVVAGGGLSMLVHAFDSASRPIELSSLRAALAILSRTAHSPPPATTPITPSATAAPSPPAQRDAAMTHDTESAAVFDKATQLLTLRDPAAAESVLDALDRAVKLPAAPDLLALAASRGALRPFSVALTSWLTHDAPRASYDAAEGPDGDGARSVAATLPAHLLARLQGTPQEWGECRARAARLLARLAGASTAALLEIAVAGAIPPLAAMYDGGEAAEREAAADALSALAGHPSTHPRLFRADVPRWAIDNVAHQESGQSRGVKRFLASSCALLMQLARNPDSQFLLIGLGVAPALRRALQALTPGQCVPAAHAVTLLCRTGHSQGAVLTRAGIVAPLAVMLHEARSRGWTQSEGACLQAMHGLLLEGGELACKHAMSAHVHVSLLRSLAAPDRAPVHRQRCLRMLRLMIEGAPGLRLVFMQRRFYATVVQVFVAAGIQEGADALELLYVLRASTPVLEILALEGGVPAIARLLEHCASCKPHAALVYPHLRHAASTDASPGPPKPPSDPFKARLGRALQQSNADAPRGARSASPASRAHRQSQINRPATARKLAELLMLLATRQSTFRAVLREGALIQPLTRLLKPGEQYKPALRLGADEEGGKRGDGRAGGGGKRPSAPSRPSVVPGFKAVPRSTVDADAEAASRDGELPGASGSEAAAKDFAAGAQLSASQRADFLLSWMADADVRHAGAIMDELALQRWLGNDVDVTRSRTLRND